MNTVVNTHEGLEKVLLTVRNADHRIGFVPTMGALHEGHLSLIRKAKAENDVVVVSIFVNPTQFNDPDDYRNYPRTHEADKAKLEKEAVDVTFMPDDAQMYPQGQSSLTDFEPGYIGQVLEGEKRPGHFSGVATIVKKLLEAVRPHQAYFGQKDYQQLLIVQHLVQAYQLPVSIVSAPIVRESDGLALSSRNVLLTPQERTLVPVIYQTLSAIKAQLEQDFQPEAYSQQGLEALNRYNPFEVEYFTIRNARTLELVSAQERPEQVVLLVALHVGKVRLIDNMLVHHFRG